MPRRPDRNWRDTTHPGHRRREHVHSAAVGHEGEAPVRSGDSEHTFAIALDGNRDLDAGCRVAGRAGDDRDRLTDLGRCRLDAQLRQTEQAGNHRDGRHGR